MHQTTNTFYRISIKAFIQNDEGEILLIKEENGMRELPGGGLDHGEEPEAGLRREIMEELGVGVKSISRNPSYFFTREEGGYRRSNIIYNTKLENLNFIPSEECIELSFFNISEIKELNLYPNVRKFINLI